MNDDNGHQVRTTRVRRSGRSATGRSTGRSTTPKGRPDATSIK
jgi:hypothetical protein